MLRLHACFVLLATSAALQRYPAVPLIVHDPFISVWSGSDHLYDAFPTFWDGGTVLGMVGMLSVDGTPYRWLGIDTFSSPNPLVPSMLQTSVTVNATSTFYTFVTPDDAVSLAVTFTTPCMGNALDVWMATPATFLTAVVSVLDAAPHNVSLYYEYTAELTVSDVSMPVTWARDTPSPVPGATLLRMGSAAQNVFGTSGDATRISWGYQYMALPSPSDASITVESSMTSWQDASNAFAKGAPLPPDDTNQPRPASQEWPVCAAAWRLGVIAPGASKTVTWMITYDEVGAMQYFGAALPPAWTQLQASTSSPGAFERAPAGVGANSITDVIARALKDQSTLQAAAATFDAALTAAAEAVADSAYADMLALAHRQVLGAVTYVIAPNGAPACPGDNNVTWPTTLPPATALRSGPLPAGVWAFMEEMSSDGDVSTVDVLYPASPAIMMYSPELAWRLMVPVLDYAANCTDIAYNLAWAPHHLGTWPICNLPPQNQEQMPLEESGNMLIMASVIAALTNTTAFMSPTHMGLLRGWGSFINSSLPMPPSQLCTDDFEGPAPNITNLAVKGINAMAAFAAVLADEGDPSNAAAYASWARQHAAFWVANAWDNSTSPGHYRRQFNLPGTWSLKYNMLYHEALQLGVFPPSVLVSEFAYYTGPQMLPYGTPLDDRHTFTLTEYMGALLGTAATQANATAIVDVLVRRLTAFLQDTPQRVPMTDWYDAATSDRVGFEARAVVGDLWSLLLVTQMRGL